MPALPGDKMLQMCSDALKLFIVAPYIKASALIRVLDAVSDTASLICITRWNPQDIIAGASDIECRAIVREHGGVFRLHPSLHAKYYRANDTVLIGSANLTNSAMGWASQPNLEILCQAGDDFDAQIFEQKVLIESREVSDAEFAQWAAISKAKVSAAPTIDAEQSPLQAWRPSTRDLRNLAIAYQGQYERIASPYEQDAARRDLQAMGVPEGLDSEQIRAWASACLLAAPFTSSVMQLRHMETTAAAASLAETYQLTTMEARRGMEAVQAWLAYLGL